MESMIEIETIGDLSPEQADDLISKIYYTFEGIRNCYLDKRQRIVMELSYDCPDKHHAVAMKIGEMVRIQKSARIFLPKIIQQQKSEQNGKGRAGHTFEVSMEGLSRVMISIDQYFQKRMKESENSRMYPSLIPLRILEQCGYPHSFPQNLYVVNEFPHLYDVMDKLKHSEDRLYSHSVTSEYALSPAVCFHVYDEFSNRVIHEPIVVNAHAKCFRHEASWRLAPHRLREFSMREYVFIGNSEFVEQIRQRMMASVWEIFISLGLSGRIETASDPFYYQEDSLKAQHQKLFEMKYELIVENGQNMFSIASFNNVQDTLCKPFRIMNASNDYHHSGCVAFGIDRWAYALMLQYGPDYELWPTGIKQLLELHKEV